MSSSPREHKGTGRIDPLVGTLIAGKYKIIKKIGEGGMGSVYIADQQPIDRKVAIKVLLGKLAEDDVAVKRFEQEARAISKMQHPNTVTIYDFGKTEDDRLYIVMEYLKGKTLTQVLRHDGVLAPTRACKIMRQVCGSLADAHAAGIIHRDLKPDNIFLSEVGGDPDWVKVLDFGVAKLADNEGAGTLTQTGMIFGTPKYMSPEQAEGRPIDYRADIYALGVVMYELLVGRPPFVADTPVGLLLKHISEPPPPFSRIRPDLNIHPGVEAIVMKSLEKHPDRRQQVVSELSAELADFERSVSMRVPIPGAFPTSQQLVPGLPTEVVPGQGGGAFTPAGLRPPNQVPGGLSLSVPAPTRDVGVPTGATGQVTGQQAGPAVPTGLVTAQHAVGQTGGQTGGQSPTSMSTAGHDVMPTAAQGVMPFAPSTGPVQTYTQGLTAPIPAPGGGVDTLGGGIAQDISTGLPPPRPKQKPVMLYAGVGLVVAALGAGAFAVSASRGGGPAGADGPPAGPTDTPVAVEPAGLREVPPRPAEPVAAREPAGDPAADPDPAPAPAEVPAGVAGQRRPVRREVVERGAEEPERAPSRKVRLNITSTPGGAMVLLDGRQSGLTPFNTEVPRDETVTLVFKKDGYEDNTRVVVAAGDRNVEVELVKLNIVPAVEAREPEPKAEVKPPRRETPSKQPDPPKADTGKLDEKVDDLK